MILVLAHANDASARYAFQRLQCRSREEILWLSVESLAAPQVVWRQQMSTEDGEVHLKLGDGRIVRTRDVRSVLNRTLAPPPLLITGTSPDASYAYSELTAFAASWIRSLSQRVINEPSPQGLSGRWRSSLAWRSLASQSGLPIEQLELDSAKPSALDETQLARGGRSVLVVAGEVFDAAVPDVIRPAIKRLAALAATPILGLRFASPPREDAWRFLDATPLPDLSLGGEAGVGAIGRLLGL